MPRLMPPTGEVGEALRRVLGSETFARSGRARDLLRYLVSREQAGEAEALKGYALALDVFGRDDGFDPSTDAVVRVQARRLRDLLAQYYESEGAGDALRIDIPLGSYVPCYSHFASAEQPQAVHAPGGPDAPVSAAPESPASTDSAAPRFRIAKPSRGVQRDLRLVWIAISAVALLLAFVAYRVVFYPSVLTPLLPREEGELTSAIPSPLPTIHVEVSSSGDDVERVASILRGALGGFDTLDYVARPYEASSAMNNRSTDFLFRLSGIAGDPNVRIEIRHAATARILVTREIDPDQSEDMIADLLTSVAPTSGAIYAFIANHGLESPLTNCLLKNDYYYRDPDEEEFIRAYDCLSELQAQGMRSPLIYSELASLQVQGIAHHFDYARDFTREKAVDGARRAIQMGPTSPYAHRSYGYLLQRLGNQSDGVAWMRKAYELNPYDLSMAAAYAYALVFSGAYSEAAPILERAVRVSSSHPGWWDYSLFLAMFMLGEKEKAANATLALETTERAHYFAVRMIVAHEAGDRAKADELRSSLIDQYPEFAADPRSFFLRARYPRDLTDKLIDSLGAAGLISAS